MARRGAEKRGMREDRHGIDDILIYGAKMEIPRLMGLRGAFIPQRRQFFRSASRSSSCTSLARTRALLRVLSHEIYVGPMLQKNGDRNSSKVESTVPRNANPHFAKSNDTISTFLLYVRIKFGYNEINIFMVFLWYDEVHTLYKDL